MLARAQWSPGQASLNDGRQTQLYASFDAMTRAALGVALPQAALQDWVRGLPAVGLPVQRLPSGAGHDAMKLHQILPQAMLFVRGENGGISHNPLESTTSDDMELAVRALQQLLANLAAEIST